ncbi:hypothetical protein [Streptomyces roseus]|uniref:Integral membrane protein n=1 Tax=Streptomyces roseus TaxID=66430 RepID=A0A0J6XFK2_9ACTN|nr:hypothetical protein [Streptomyces roseus]KMO93904.1 hypothetical protein ACS04_32260 [Streptomyces roseus]
MQRIIGGYGSQSAIRRNAGMVIAGSVVLYVLAALLATKGGWPAAFPVLLVAVIVDAVCLVVWLAFRSRRPS